MTSGLMLGDRRVSTRTLLVMLGVVAVVAALITPESTRERGGLSSRSAASGGARIAFELARRMGWPVDRRDAPLDSMVDGSSVHVVIGPQQALGAREVHRLLENVRRGGGLVFSVDEAGEIADSLGMAIRSRGDLLVAARGGDCPRRGSFGARRAAAIPPTVHQIVWRRPPPGEVLSLATGFSIRVAAANVAIGFPMGRGRVAAVSTAEVFANDVMRTCDWGADVTIARAFDFVRPTEGAMPRMVFDEYHHGYGVHPGSVKAIASYLSGAASGRFFATLLIAGAVLLFAASPRPVLPREPGLIARRSPLEHADALAQAYADVGGTRTATARLVSGLRRRAGRAVPLHSGADDLAFLDAVALRAPSLAALVAVVRRGLGERVANRDLPSIGDAIVEIERTLTTTPPTRP